MGPRRSRSAPTWLLLPLLSACAASSPVQPSTVRIEDGRRTRVLLTDTRSNRSLVLQNLSSGTREQVYGDTSGDALVKVVDDASLQRLIDVLDSEGMFRVARSQAAPGASALLVVQQPERTFVWSRPQATPSTLDQVKAFDQSRGYVMALYNATTSYHARDFASDDMEAVRSAIEKASRDSAAGDPTGNPAGNPTGNPAGKSARDQGPRR